MRVLLWHVHGSWTTSFVQGTHEYLIPVNDARDADGLGRARTWDWPDGVVEVRSGELADADVDVVVLQRPHELDLVERWSRRRPGVDLPAVFLEHNTPTGPAVTTRHPLADRTDIEIVHVTHFNRSAWDCGGAPTVVVEHGIVDPGHRFTGELARAAVVMNDPVRRARVLGADLLPPLAADVPVDVFGMRVELLRGQPWTSEVGLFEDLPQEAMHAEVARRRVYVHTARWTSLGLSLLEAMCLGLPVVVLGATEAPRAVPPGAGVVSTDPADLARAARRFVDDPSLGAEVGHRGREVALERYGLDRFLARWDEVLADAVR